MHFTASNAQVTSDLSLNPYRSSGNLLYLILSASFMLFTVLTITLVSKPVIAFRIFLVVCISSQTATVVKELQHETFLWMKHSVS
jgi:hypothetical protein